MRKYYESPDMFNPEKLNIYDNSTRLCGVFIGYIETKAGKFTAYPVDRNPMTFASMPVAKRYITGSSVVPGIPERKVDLEGQMKLF